MSGPSLFTGQNFTDLGQKETAKTLVHRGQDFKSSNLNNDY